MQRHSYFSTSKMKRTSLGFPRRSSKKMDRFCPRATIHKAADSLDYTIREVSLDDNSMIRATAYLRAAAFYEYPAGRSEFVARSHRRMKADEEWEGLEARMRGTDKYWKGVRVLPIVAVRPYDPEDPVSQALDQELDRSAKIPAGAVGEKAGIVVGTLDINFGVSIPSEELIGRHPGEGEGDPWKQRVYYANVCVAKSLRRQGLAARLLKYGEEMARREGGQWMYVHVIATNTPAVELYKRAGFTVEVEENENFARGLDRPRRMLLVKDIRT